MCRTLSNTVLKTVGVILRVHERCFGTKKLSDKVNTVSPPFHPVDMAWGVRGHGRAEVRQGPGVPRLLRRHRLHVRRQARLDVVVAAVAPRPENQIGRREN